MPPTPAPKPDDPFQGKGGRKETFWIAMALIVGAIMLPAIPAFRGDYVAAKDLITVVTGWIFAVTGFFFFTGQAEKNLESGRALGERTALGKTGAVVDDIEATKETYKRLYEKALAAMEDAAKDP